MYTHAYTHINFLEKNNVKKNQACTGQVRLRIKNCDQHEVTAKYYFLGAEGCLMLMGPKVLIKMIKMINLAIAIAIPL